MENEQIIYQPENISIKDGKFIINEEGKKEIRDNLTSLFGYSKIILNLNTILSSLNIDLNQIIELSFSGKIGIDVVELAGKIAELEFYIKLIEESFQISKNVKNKAELKIYETFYKRIEEYMESQKAEVEKTAEENDSSETLN